MAYIRYNQALKQRFDSLDVIDPIVQDEIDFCDEWLVGEMLSDGEDAGDDLVFNDDNNLTRGDVANAPANRTSSYQGKGLLAKREESEDAEEDMDLEEDDW